MAQDREPRVPDGPVGGQGNKPSEPAATTQTTPGDGGGDDGKGKGGRRPYDEILEESKALARRVEELKTAVEPFSRMPDDGAKGAGDVLYRLVRGDQQCEIRCGDVRRAVRALRG